MPVSELGVGYSRLRISASQSLMEPDPGADSIRDLWACLSGKTGLTGLCRELEKVMGPTRLDHRTHLTGTT